MIDGPLAPAEPEVAHPPSPITADMRQHFAAIRSIERAAVVGDVEKMREHARWLAEPGPIDAAIDYQQQLEEMRATAADLAEAADLAAAIPLAAQLGAACGACHVATTAITSFPYAELPTGEKSVRERMARHLWATDRLWEGLVGPSTALWQTGAQMLAADTLKVSDIANSPAAGSEITRLATQVRGLAQRASKTDDQSERATLYGELLTTCAECHQYVRQTRAQSP